MRSRIGLALLGAGLLLTPAPAAAQWTYEASVQTAHDTNPLGLNQTPASWTSLARADVRRAWRRLAVGYAGSFTRLHRLPDFDAFWHEAELLLGDDTTYAGLRFEQRRMLRDRTYDFDRLAADAGRRFRFAHASADGQLSLRRDRYPVLDDHDQWAAAASLRAYRSFSTGSTIIADATLGAAVFTSLRATGSPPRRHAAPRVGQLGWGLRFAQALAPATGLALQYREQHLGTEGLTADLAATNASFTLLDDPMLYAYRSAGVELTQLLPRAALTLKAGAYRTLRRHAVPGVYRSAEEFLLTEARRDGYTTAWLAAAWRLRPPWLRGRTLEVRPAFQWSVNHSNSYWYRYASRYASLGLALGP